MGKLSSTKPVSVAKKFGLRHQARNQETVNSSPALALKVSWVKSLSSLSSTLTGVVGKIGRGWSNKYVCCLEFLIKNKKRQGEKKRHK